MAVQSLTTRDHPFLARNYTVGERANRYGKSPAIVKEIRLTGADYYVIFDTRGSDIVIVKRAYIAAVDPPRYRQLPVGTVFTFTSARGSRIVVEIVGDVMRGRYGGARQVKVLEAPPGVNFDDTAQPTHLFCVPPGTPARQMQDAFTAAIPSISPGDTVYLSDAFDVRHDASSIEVVEVTVKLP